jgi:hypothetical protein
MPLDAAKGRPAAHLPGLPLHMRYALEITSVHRIRPTPEGRTRALRTCLLRRRYPAPNDGVEVKDLRPLTRSALAGRSLTRRRNRRCPKAAENDRKRSTIRISPSLTSPSPVPFRDDDALGKTVPGFAGGLLLEGLAAMGGSRKR